MARGKVSKGEGGRPTQAVQGLVTLPVVATAVVTGILVRRKRRHRARGSADGASEIAEDAGRSLDRQHANTVGLLGRLPWLLQGVPLMIVSTGVVALAAGPLVACLVAALGLLRVLLLHQEQSQRQGLPVDEGAVDVPWGSFRAEREADSRANLQQQQEQEEEAEEEEEDEPEELLPISGVWRKDNKLSEPMTDMMNLVKLNPIIRRAVSLVNGLELHVTNKEFKMAVLCAIPWFKVTERYPMNGEPRKFKRRDLRRGQHIGSVKPVGDGVRVELAWPEPFAGIGSDTMWCPEPDVLHVLAVATVNGESASYLHVYHRRI